jgi:hypothetical protein
MPLLIELVQSAHEREMKMTRQEVWIAMAGLLGVACGVSDSLAATDCVTLSKVASAGPFQNAQVTLHNGSVQLDLSAGPFWQSPTTVAFGSATVGNSMASCFSGDPSLELNNADLIGLLRIAGAPISAVSIDYCDLGGGENVSARAAPVDHIGEIDVLDGQSVSAGFGILADVKVSEMSVAGGMAGTIEFHSKDLSGFVVGGQEFAINQICVTQ